jgi:hypothetical protein
VLTGGKKLINFTSVRFLQSKEKYMRKVASIGLLVLFILGSSPAAACQYWKCYEFETTATCSYFFCNGSGCDGAIYALRCGVTCHTMGGGGCFCDPDGTQCYDV